jgi:hypothetical protein
MRKLLTFLIALASIALGMFEAAGAQQYMPLPPNTLMGNLLPLPQPGSAVTIPELLSALSSRGLVIDQMTKVGAQTAYSISPGDRVVATSAPFTASVTWTLPAAADTIAGHTILVVDLAGSVSGPKPLVIAPASRDTINGSGTSLTISSTFGAYYLVSDGLGAWNAQALVGISVTPGAGLTSSVSAACLQSPIAAFGTLSRAECINPQTGTSYVVQDGDRAKLITASNAAAQAYSIAQAGVGSAFQSGWYVDIHNISTNPAGILTLTPATSTINGLGALLIYPGQSVRIVSDGANYQTSFYPVLTNLMNSLGSDVSLSTQNFYFDGPSVAQGTVGTWFVSGKVTLLDTAGLAVFFCKLWDGTTVIDSLSVTSAGASDTIVAPLSGAITSPAANIKISCEDTSRGATGAIKFNSSGNSKDSTMSALRIQ